MYCGVQHSDCKELIEMNNSKEKEHIQPLRFLHGLIIFLTIIVILSSTIIGYSLHPHIPLLLATVIAGCLLLAFGQSWNDIEKAVMKGLQASLMPSTLLALIGVLIAVWMMSGTVPSLIVYGTYWFQPQWFTISALFLTVIVSMFVGSSLTTIGTIGVALIGIADSMSVHPTVVAGAVISGACFGDKMSPLSDTTNFAAAVAQVTIPNHIRNMMKTTVPTFLLTCIAFLCLGSAKPVHVSQLAAIQQDIQRVFYIHPLTLLPLFVVMIAAFKRVPIIMTMLWGIGSGLVVTALLQGNIHLSQWMNWMQNGYQGSFSLREVNHIINRGGLQAMTWSISLIAIAFALGGLLQHTGVIMVMFTRIITPVKRREVLVITSGLSAIGINFITGEQYLSILLPGQLFANEYTRRNIPRQTLSRTLEDCGTLVNPLIPWGVSGAMMTNTLGLSVVDYIPYAFFLWLSPLITFACALLPGLKEATLHDKKR